MSAPLPQVVLARHGETPWSLSGQHTSFTDLSLTERGEANARALCARLWGQKFSTVLTSPLARARQTCELAGYDAAEVVPDLMEWNYGEYEGKTTAEIQRSRPNWILFREGCPGGESPEQVGVRADRVIARLRANAGNVLVFSSGHFLRVLTARWLGMPASEGRLFHLSTASVSILGYEHTVDEPVILLWNDDRHVAE